MSLSDLPRDLKVESSGPGSMGLGINPEDVVCLLKRNMSDSELSQVRLMMVFNGQQFYPSLISEFQFRNTSLRQLF